MSIVSIFGSKGKKEFFVDEAEMLWLNGTLLCRRLGFANPSKSIPLHVEENDRQKVDVGALHPAWFVNEPGTWSMIIEAKTPEAKEFKRDLTTKILPSIRQHGAYISPDITPVQAVAVKERIDRILDSAAPWERLYDENRNKGFAWFGYRFYTDYVYCFLTAEEWCKINTLNPVRKEANGRCDREQRIHQYIEPETKARLRDTVAVILGFVDASNTPEEFQELYRRKYGRVAQLELTL